MNENTITFKQILFDLKLQIKNFVIIKFLNVDECNKYMTELIFDKTFKNITPTSVYSRHSKHMAVDCKKQEFTLTNFEIYADYIQIDNDKFVRRKNDKF